MTSGADRLERLADAYRAPTMLMFDYNLHRWSVWIGLSGCKGIHLGQTAGEALGKAEHKMKEVNGE